MLLKRRQSTCRPSPSRSEPSNYSLHEQKRGQSFLPWFKAGLARIADRRTQVDVSDGKTSRTHSVRFLVAHDPRTVEIQQGNEHVVQDVSHVIEVYHQLYQRGCEQHEAIA